MSKTDTAATQTADWTTVTDTWGLHYTHRVAPHCNEDETGEQALDAFSATDGDMLTCSA